MERFRIPFKIHHYDFQIPVLNKSLLAARCGRILKDFFKTIFEVSIQQTNLLKPYKLDVECIHNSNPKIGLDPFFLSCLTVMYGSLPQHQRLDDFNLENALSFKFVISPPKFWHSIYFLPSFNNRKRPSRTGEVQDCKKLGLESQKFLGSIYISKRV